jgi:hypothetical protein
VIHEFDGPEHRILEEPLEQQSASRYEDINRERKARELKEFIPGGNPKQIKKIAREAEENYTPVKTQQIIDEINDSHRAITPEERALILIHKDINQKTKQQLKTQFFKNKNPKVGRELEGQLKENQRQFNDITRALAMANHDAAQSMRFIQMESDKDWYTDQGVISRIESTTGKTVRPEQRRAIMEMTQKLEDLQTKKAQLDADLGGQLDSLDQRAKALGYSLPEVIKRAESAKGRLATGPEVKALFDLVNEYNTLKSKSRSLQTDYEIAKQMNRIDEKVSSMKPKSLLGWIGEPGNLARTVATSYDVSAPGRQGIALVLSHPIKAAKVLPKMFGAFSDFNAFKYEKELQNRPNYDTYVENNLLSDLGGYGNEEESFHSILASKLPGVPASQRAYTTFLNQLRADVFDSLAGQYTNGSPTKEQAAAIANFVKIFSGKGDLGNHQKALETMNLVFWAPKLIASRIQMLVGQPLLRAAKTDAFTTKLVAKEYGKMLVGAGTVLGLAALVGFKVDLDPRSASFGKIQIGNTKVDVLGGLSQITTLGGRLFTGKTKTQSGLIEPTDKGDVLSRFLRTKLSPVLGTAWDIFGDKNQENVVGEKTTLLPEDYSSFKSWSHSAPGMAIPMSFKDIYEAMQEQGMEKGAALGLLSTFGFGVQSYHPEIDDKLKDLPGQKNQPLEDALLKLQQFKIDHPEIQRITPEGGPPEKKQFNDTMRRAEELIRRGSDPTALLAKELDVPAGDKLGISSSLIAREKLADLKPELKQELKSRIGETDFNLLQSNDDLLHAWADQYRIADQISEFKGAKAAKEFLKSPSPELLKARLKIASVEREVREKKGEIFESLRNR